MDFGQGTVADEREALHDGAAGDSQVGLRGCDEGDFGPHLAFLPPYVRLLDLAAEVRRTGEASY